MADDTTLVSANGTQPRHAPDAPVFVLCNGRSGSTLLRFLLDAHPELACPPETNLPVMASQLATVWSLIEGAPLSAERGDEPPVIPEAAITGVRRTMDEMTYSYLARRGKKGGSPFQALFATTGLAVSGCSSSARGNFHSRIMPTIMVPMLTNCAGVNPAQ